MKVRNKTFGILRFPTEVSSKLQKMHFFVQCNDHNSGRKHENKTNIENVAWNTSVKISCTQDVIKLKPEGIEFSRPSSKKERKRNFSCHGPINVVFLDGHKKLCGWQNWYGRSKDGFQSSLDLLIQLRFQKTFWTYLWAQNCETLYHIQRN